MHSGEDHTIMVVDIGVGYNYQKCDEVSKARRGEEQNSPIRSERCNVADLGTVRWENTWWREVVYCTHVANASTLSLAFPLDAMWS